MKRLLFVFIILYFNKNVKSQVPEDFIKQTINGLFLGMKNADTGLVKGCFSDSAILQTILKNEKGEVIVKTGSLVNFYNWIAQEKAGNADERIVFETIKLDGTLATAWLPYKFYYKGKLSHCGVNAVQLINTSNGWKIQYLIDTRHKTGCE